MRVRFWGVRGSFPVAHPRVFQVGGNSSCVEVACEGAPRVILDAGTGLRPLGKALMKEPEFAEGRGEGALLISHTHWDHIQGFMFFEPFAVPGNHFTVYARATHDARVKSIFTEQASETYFTRTFDSLQADFSWRAVSEQSKFSIGPIEVRTARLNHPGVAVAYRLDHAGSSVVYVTDTAPYDDQLLGDGFHIRRPSESPAVLELIQEYQEKLVELCRDVDLMIYDTFFTMEQYQLNPHWGHSTPERGIALARESGARQFYFFHHHPEAWDDELIARVESYDERYGDDSLSIRLAREGLSVELAK